MTTPFAHFGSPKINQKDIRIKKLYERGMRRPTDIARKIGYNSGTMEEGVRCVIASLAKSGIVLKAYEAKNTNQDPSHGEDGRADSASGDQPSSAPDRMEEVCARAT